MHIQDDLQTRWWALETKLVERFGKKPDLETILFLIGIQEFGQLKEKFTKEQKQDLMHVAVCSLFLKVVTIYWREMMMKAGHISGN